jgi:hypothetical protein
MSKPTEIDFVEEFGALEGELSLAQERATESLALAMKLITEDSIPVFPSVRVHRQAIAHLTNAVVELKNINDGLVSGLMEMIRVVVDGQEGGSNAN